MMKSTKRCQIKVEFHLSCVSPSFSNRSIAPWKLHGGASRFSESKSKATTQSWPTTSKNCLGERWVPCVNIDRRIKHRSSTHQVIACISWARGHWLPLAIWKFWFNKKFVLFSLILCIFNLLSSNPIKCLYPLSLNLNCYNFKNMLASLRFWNINNLCSG